MRIRCLIVLLVLFPSLAVAGQSSHWNAESRWKFVSTQSDPGPIQAYLFEYPESPHVAEARARLQARNHTPLARFTTPAWSTVLQQRAQPILASARRQDQRALYDLVVPTDHFLTSSTLVVVPRGGNVNDTPIEKQPILNLVANRRGGCSIMERWSGGSGLPDECQCQPIDPAFRFPSGLAEAVLGKYAKLQAVNTFCMARGADDLMPAIDGYHASAVDAYRLHANALRDGRPTGHRQPAREPTDLADFDEALLVLAHKATRPEACQQQVWTLGDMRPEQLDGLCRGRLKGRIDSDISELRQYLPVDPDGEPAGG